LAVLTFLEARAMVLRELRAVCAAPAIETCPIDDCCGRVLAEDITADRDYPPFHRSTRDGFAVRSTDVPGTLHVVGEARAGMAFGGASGDGATGPGEAVEIMTGAPVPEGADAVIMVEHCTRPAADSVSTDHSAAPNSNISPAGCEARAGAVVLHRGIRIDYACVGWLATVGRTTVPVFARPRVAILSTGDEIVEIGETPGRHQIRNSNAHALAAQVRRAGGIPVILPIAPDNKDATVRLIAQGLKTDLLLLSGGVSAGKYDFVEPALAEFGARFCFDRVAIQPGQPVVFGKAAKGTLFFGLPGNPASTMVTFEIFARAAIDLLSGAEEAPLPMTLAKLTRKFTHKPGLTRFLPAVLACAEVTPVDWQGSGDIPSLCRATAFLVADPNQAEYAKGDLIPVLLK
jgi:molybdopterin molybdotransferase